MFIKDKVYIPMN